MNPLLILFAVLVVLALIFVWISLQSFRRWWTKPYANPAKLYRQLRKMKKISRVEHRAILEKSLVNVPAGSKGKPRVDWLKACAKLFNA